MLISPGVTPAARFCCALCEAFSIPSPSSHTVTTERNHHILTVLLQPIFSHRGEWEPCGPWWQVWIIPVIFRLKHYSNKENTYYPSRAVSTHSDPLTPACPGEHYSFNVPSKPQTHMSKLITTHDPTKLHWEARAQSEHHSYKALLSLFCTSPRQGHVDLEGKSSAK